MAAITANTVREWKPSYPEHYQSYPLTGSTVDILQGALVCLTTAGYAVEGADTAGYVCVGIADQEVLNGYNKDSLTAFVRVRAGCVKLDATSITLAMTATAPAMYLVNNGTVDDAAGATNDVFVGILVEFISTTSGWVWIQGPIAEALFGTTSSSSELNKLDGIPAAAYLVVASEVTFTETTGAGVYTGSVSLAADTTILDVIVNGVALWNTTTSANMVVGDATDPDGYYTNIDLKATDLLAGESLSFALAGGKAGAYIANSQVSPRYSASTRVISGIITSVGAAGTLGRTRMLVIYVAPTAAAATKV